MRDPRKQERRRRLLKERKAAEQREYDLEDAQYHLRTAEWFHRSGDEPAAAREAEKALRLDPGLYLAVELLAKIHFLAGQWADAAYYLVRLRNTPAAIAAAYNLGEAHFELGRPAEALKDFQDFLEAVRPLRDPKWAGHQQRAEQWVRKLAALTQAAGASTAAPAPAAGMPEAPPPVPKREPPRVTVAFLDAPAPAFDPAPAASAADYFLRRRLLELRLAQNFDDLVCLASLHGVDTYHYQQETVRKVLRHFKGRALLADEVGLGKTIEACLILKEYWTRGMVRKALVLTPPSLVSQWRGELAEKFGLAAATPDDAAFRSNPSRFWAEEPLIVASIATARLEPHASALAGASWDIVIVDEAHCLKNRTSANWKLVNSLNKRFILMLTATPIENKLVELYNLITVLKPGLLSTEAEFRKQFVVPGRPKSPLSPERLRSLVGEVMVRNTRAAADVHLPRRNAASIVVPPSAAEARLYRRVSDFVSRRYRDKARGATTFALHVLQRQAGSSPYALGRSVARSLTEAEWTGASDRRDLESILELSSQLLWTGKSLQLGRMLADRPGKTVVFTEFVPTLHHLAEVCARNAVQCAVFSGEMSRAEKDAAIARFRDDVDVLLSTGSGGEGRNLQFANTVINYDLPWNPMRLEQRIGRVHRIGQTQDVFVFNLCQAGTIEEQLLRVLHEKINMFELVVGEVDGILGILDEGRDFSDLVLDLWVSARASGQVEQAFDELADRLLEAKSHYMAAKRLDATLFDRDFEA